MNVRGQPFRQGSGQAGDEGFGESGSIRRSPGDPRQPCSPLGASVRSVSRICLGPETIPEPIIDNMSLWLSYVKDRIHPIMQLHSIFKHYATFLKYSPECFPHHTSNVSETSIRGLRCCVPRQQRLGAAIPQIQLAQHTVPDTITVEAPRRSRA